MWETETIGTVPPATRISVISSRRDGSLGPGQGFGLRQRCMMHVDGVLPLVECACAGQNGKGRMKYWMLKARVRLDHGSSDSVWSRKGKGKLTRTAMKERKGVAI